MPTNYLYFQLYSTQHHHYAENPSPSGGFSFFSDLICGIFNPPTLFSSRDVVLAPTGARKNNPPRILCVTPPPDVYTLGHV